MSCSRTFQLVLTSILVFGLWSLSPRSVQAQGSGFFSSSPGDLAREHAPWDNADGCNDCHVNGKKDIDRNKCLDCHDHNDLRARIRSGKGYHSSSTVKKQRCESCHLDHKGRSFNMMAWATIPKGEKGFDHKDAGWPLKGKHAVVDCKDCHKKKNKAGRRTYLGEEPVCGSCHKDDQPHGIDRKALMQCDRCHTQVAWKPPVRRLDFDHNKKSHAEFPLEGAHVDVACGKCHPKSKFNLRRGKPGNCGNSGCHKTAHKDMLFGKKSCAWCHSPKLSSIKEFTFNHAARTRFDLRSSHEKLDCYDCHTKELKTKKPSRSCATCHESGNPHKTRFRRYGNPPACETCHPESSWKATRFRHKRKTRFGLNGKHAKSTCRDCHPGNRPDEFLNVSAATGKGSRCMGCHTHKNAHSGEFTDKPKKQKVMRNGRQIDTCRDCHDEGVREVDGENAAKGIHTEGGRYPLKDGHAGVGCLKCHDKKSFSGTSTNCGGACHDDSLHAGSLGEKCEDCHQPGIWIATRFDHRDDTDWPLEGLHSRVAECAQCHPNRKFANTPRNCSAVGCHAKDDVHKGKLGDKCESCHKVTGEITFDHNKQSSFKLSGKHYTTRCGDCHPSITFKPRPTTCYGDGECHPEPAVHKGQFGTACGNCHSTQSFANVEAVHDVGDFNLKGAHDQQSCERCHSDTRRLSGTGNLCINCHRSDDIHSNSLSPRCGTCHNQWAFAPAQFNHTTVGCNLSGLHRTLPCSDCHKTGSYGGLSARCYACHKADIPVGGTDHTAFIQCAGCHNANVWLPAFKNVAKRESVCW